MPEEFEGSEKISKAEAAGSIVMNVKKELLEKDKRGNYKNFKAEFISVNKDHPISATIYRNDVSDYEMPKGYEDSVLMELHEGKYGVPGISNSFRWHQSGEYIVTPDFKFLIPVDEEGKRMVFFKNRKINKFDDYTNEYKEVVIDALLSNKKLHPENKTKIAGKFPYEF